MDKKPHSQGQHDARGLERSHTRSVNNRSSTGQGTRSNDGRVKSRSRSNEMRLILGQTESSTRADDRGDRKAARKNVINDRFCVQVEIRQVKGLSVPKKALNDKRRTLKAMAHFSSPGLWERDTESKLKVSNDGEKPKSILEKTQHLPLFSLPIEEASNGKVNDSYVPIGVQWDESETGGPWDGNKRVLIFKKRGKGFRSKKGKSKTAASTGGEAKVHDVKVKFGIMFDEESTTLDAPVYVAEANVCFSEDADWIQEFCIPVMPVADLKRKCRSFFKWKQTQSQAGRDQVTVKTVQNAEFELSIIVMNNDQIRMEKAKQKRWALEYKRQKNKVKQTIKDEDDQVAVINFADSNAKPFHPGPTKVDGGSHADSSSIDGAEFADQKKTKCDDDGHAGCPDNADSTGLLDDAKTGKLLALTQARITSKSPKNTSPMDEAATTRKFATPVSAKEKGQMKASKQTTKHESMLSNNMTPKRASKLAGSKKKLRMIPSSFKTSNNSDQVEIIEVETDFIGNSHVESAQSSEQYKMIEFKEADETREPEHESIPDDVLPPVIWEKESHIDNNSKPDAHLHNEDFPLINRALEYLGIEPLANWDEFSCGTFETDSLTSNSRDGDITFVGKKVENILQSYCGLVPVDSGDQTSCDNKSATSTSLEGAYISPMTTIDDDDISECSGFDSLEPHNWSVKRKS